MRNDSKGRNNFTKSLLKMILDLKKQIGSVDDGGGETPTLQEVTNEGNTTTNPVSVVDELGYGITIGQNQIDLSSLSGFQAFQLSGQHLKIGESFNYLELIAERLQYSNSFGSKGTLLFPDLGKITIEETIATQEWVQTNIPLTTTVEISSAQLLALATTPVELIPAQGAGTYIVLDNVISVYEYGTEEYDFDQPVDINLDGFSYISFVLTSPSNNVLFQSVSNYTVSENQALMLEYSSTPPTQGDGTLKLILTYRIITI